MRTQYYGLMEISKELHVPYWRIIYAERAGYIAEPLRIATKRAYTENDLQQLRQYFQTNKN